MRITRRSFLLRGLAPAASTTLLLPHLVGCGSLLYPERVGQPRIGPLDWKVVALDGLGLLLFFVPGVVAFVVDFYNGTIFLPPYTAQSPPMEYVPTPQPPEGALPPPPNASEARPSAAEAPPNAWGREDFETIDVPRDQLTREGIERAISQHVGRTVALDHEAARVARLNDLSEFGDLAHRLASGQIEGLPLEQAFLPLQEASLDART